MAQVGLAWLQLLFQADQGSGRQEIHEEGQGSGRDSSGKTYRDAVDNNLTPYQGAGTQEYEHGSNPL